MRLIEAQSEQLTGVLPITYTDFTDELLAELLRIFNNSALDEVGGDVIGRIYEYFLNKFAKNVPEKTKKAIETRFNSSTDGVQIEEELVRRYTDGIIYFSNIIGYTGEADESYLEEEEHAGTDEQGHPLYHEGDMIGLTGIEASQEPV